MGTTTTSSTTPDPFEPTNAAERVLSTLESEPRASIASTKALAFRLLAALLTFSAVPWRWFLRATTETRPAAFLRYLEALPEADAVDVLGALALAEGLNPSSPGSARIFTLEILLPRFGHGPLRPAAVVALEALRSPVEAVELRPGGFALDPCDDGAELVDLRVARVLAALRAKLRHVDEAPSSAPRIVPKPSTESPRNYAVRGVFVLPSRAPSDRGPGAA